MFFLRLFIGSFRDSIYLNLVQSHNLAAALHLQARNIFSKIVELIVNFLLLKFQQQNIGTFCNLLNYYAKESGFSFVCPGKAILLSFTIKIMGQRPKYFSKGNSTHFLWSKTSFFLIFYVDVCEKSDNRYCQHLSSTTIHDYKMPRVFMFNLFGTKNVFLIHMQLLLSLKYTSNRVE